MATPMVKSTYALDAETLAALEDVARRWGVTKSEALRRAIRAAAQGGKGMQAERLAAWDELQRLMALQPDAARAWQQRSRAERRRSSEKGLRRKA
jgi:transposase-like protein